MSSSVVTDLESAVGASLTGVTEMSIVAIAEVSDLSLTVNVNESTPLKFAFGV